ncbi:MAG: amidase family protein [Endozoicomonas sp.]
MDIQAAKPLMQSPNQLGSALNHTSAAFQKACKKSHPESYVLDGKANKGLLLKAQRLLAERSPRFATCCRTLAGVGKIQEVTYSANTSGVNPESSSGVVSSTASIITPQEYLTALQGITEKRSNKASHLDRAASDWKGFTGEDLESGIKAHIQTHPDHESVIGDMFEHYNSDGDANSIPVSVKSEYNVEGEEASHGIRGQADQQTETTGFLKSILDKSVTGFRRVATSAMHALGAGATGVNPKSPNVANVYRPELSSGRCKSCFGAGVEDRIPGGSSSGATTSVASGATPVAIGSDGGGSGRICPALQGVVGAKSGGDFFDTSGSAYGSNDTLVQPAIIANNVTNCAELALAIGNKKPTAACQDHTKLKVCIDMDSIGITRSGGDEGNEIADRCERLFSEWNGQYRAEGDGDHEIHLHELETHPANVRRLARSHIALFGSEERKAFSELSDDQRQQADDELKLNMAMAKSIPENDLRAARANREAFKQRLADLKQQGIDVICMPTTLKTARLILPGERLSGLGDLKGALELGQFTSLANMSNTASVTFSGGVDSKGMPIGVMLMSTSPEVDLYELFPIAAQFENITRDNTEFVTPEPDVFVFDDVKAAHAARIEQKG